MGRSWLAVVLVVTLGGCEKCGSLHPFSDAADAASSDAMARRPPPFVCKAPPACPDGARPPHGPTLAREVRARLARGALEEATTLVACARRDGEEIAIEAEPGFERATFSPDGAHLLTTVDASALARVFDTKTGEETMRFGDRSSTRVAMRRSADVAALAANLALVPHGKTAGVWDLDKETEVLVSGLITGAVGASDHRHWLWAASFGEMMVARAEDVKNDGFTTALQVKLAPAERSAVQELPGNHLAVFDGVGRWMILDATSGAPLATVSTVRGPDVVVEHGVVFDEGDFLTFGDEDPALAPKSAPLYIDFDDRPPFKHLSAPGCMRSLALAASPDGTLLLSAKRDGYCVFDLRSRALLGTVPADVRARYDAPRAAFAGNTLAVAEHGRLVMSITRGAQPAVRTIAPIGNGFGAILQRDVFVHDVAGPRVIVGMSGSTEPPRAITLNSDGTRTERVVDVMVDEGAYGSLSGSGLAGGFVIGDPPHLVGGGRALTSVMSCEALSQKPCIPLSLSGAAAASPDGRFVAGPADTRVSFTAPPFSGHESLAIIDPATGDGHHYDAPGIDAVTFTSNGELEVLGDDGAIVACALPKGPCRVRARVERGPIVVPSEPGVIVTYTKDAPGLRVDGEAKPVLASQKAASIGDHYEHGGDPRHSAVVHGGRGLWISDETAKLVARPLGREGVARTLADSPCELAVDSAGRTAACLTNGSVRVLTIDAGELLYEETFAATPADATPAVRGAVALSPDGAYLAYANGNGFAIVEIATKHVVARQALGKVTETAGAITVADGGRVAAVLLESSFVLLERAAPGALTRISLLESGIHNDLLATLASSSDGYVALRWADGNAVLVDPQHRVAAITRASIDDGLWITRAGRTVPLGEVRATSTAVACRLGASMFPARACLPSTCDPSL